jgi:hypothetical protein
MSQINFAEDKAESITQANDAGSLSEQVMKLRDLEDLIEKKRIGIKKD